MRALKVTVLSVLAAAALASAPVAANAGPHWHGGGGGWHRGWGGPGLLFGLAAGALVAGAVADANCVQFVPVYDAYGNVVGRRRVWAC
jgi:hypothetical protein